MSLQRISPWIWPFVSQFVVSSSFLNPSHAIQKALSSVMWIALYTRSLCGIVGEHRSYQYLPFLPLMSHWIFRLHLCLDRACPKRPRCLLQVALCLLLVSLKRDHRAISVPLPSRNHSSSHLDHHPSLHSPSQLVGQGQSTEYPLTDTQPWCARLGADMQCVRHTVASIQMRCGVAQ